MVKHGLSIGHYMVKIWSWHGPKISILKEHILYTKLTQSQQFLEF